MHVDVLHAHHWRLEEVATDGQFGGRCTGCGAARGFPSQPKYLDIYRDLAPPRRRREPFANVRFGVRFETDLAW